MSCSPGLRRWAGPPALLVALAALLCAVAPAVAQTAPAPRPRIGLALGGGSARGLAHVGVLEWLAEHRIPVDVIAGTSMGGLIAGTYATGMTPPEIRALVRGTDWGALLSADSPFTDKTFRRKQDRRSFPAPLELGVKRGVSLPRALNPGQRVALLFDRLALPYAEIRSFDDLPTPYRCVAFDLVRAERVVLADGSLPEAMRATMAIPGVFAPVAMGSRQLIDGGVTDNVPADVVRGMHADVVIAVDVTVDPAVARVPSFVSTIDRTVDAVITAATRESLRTADVVIRPDRKGLTSTDWERAEAWRERGYKAAEARAADLLRYSVSPEQYAAYEAERRSRRRTEAPVPTSIVVTGVPDADQRRIARQLAGNVGQPLSADRIEQDILLVAGTGRYESLTYATDTTPSGSTRLLIDVRPKPNGPEFLSAALELNNMEAGSFAMSVAGRTTMYDLAGERSEGRLDLAVGTRLEAAGELYKPLGRGPFFVAPRWYARRGRHNSFADERLVGEYTLARYGVGIDVGVGNARTTEVRLGFDTAHAQQHVRVGGDTLPEADGAERFAALSFAHDGQNGPVIPTRGTLVHASLRRFLAAPRPIGLPEVVAGLEAPQRFWQGEAEATMFRPVGGAGRLFLRGAGGTSFDARPFLEDFSLGGPFRMGAFSNDELRGAHYALGVVGYLHELKRFSTAVSGRTYLAGWVEGGSAFQARSEADWHGDVTAGVVVDAPLGPMFVGGSVGPGGHWRLYLAFGPLFR